MLKSIEKVECGADIVSLFEKDGRLVDKLRKNHMVRVYVRGEDVYIAGVAPEFVLTAAETIRSIVIRGKSDREFTEELTRLNSTPSDINLRSLTMVIQNARALYREEDLLTF